MSSVDLSIIIPAYHEADRIEQSLLTLAGHLKEHHYGNVEVLIMAQSDDDTSAAAKHDAKYFEHFRVINLGKRAGKGGAVRAGIFEARGRYKMFMDADMATPLHHLEDIAKIIAEDGKVGIAVRNIISTHHGLRKLLSEFGNLLTQILIAPGIKDTQCGFKVFESEAAAEIFGRQTILGWAFDMEILLIARRLGYKINTFPANDWKDPKANGLVGESALKASAAMFKDMLKIRWQAINGKYQGKTFVYEPSKNTSR